MNCLIHEQNSLRLWQDYVADHIGGIAYSLANMGKKKPSGEFKPYSAYVHVSRKKRKTDNMSAKEIVKYISDKL